MPQTLKHLISQLAGRHILVIGDVLLDEYLVGRATRISREAPIPVLEFESHQFIAGGAANPAANLVALGSHAMQIGVVGDDDNAANLKSELQRHGIDVSGLITDATRPTTVKTRILAQMGLRFPQQVARMDRLSRQPISSDVESRLNEVIKQQFGTAAAALLSDYHGGLLTPSLVDQVRHSAHKQNKIVTADAQGALGKYRGLTLVKCNADDASDYLNQAIKSDGEFARAAADLFQVLELAGAMVITRGAEGATLATSPDNVIHCPAPSITDVYDTVGAGDTSIAVMTLAITAGASYADAVMLANYASGLVVRRVGNYAPTPDELAWALENWQI